MGWVVGFRLLLFPAQASRIEPRKRDIFPSKRHSRGSLSALTALTALTAGEPSGPRTKALFFVPNTTITVT